MSVILLPADRGIGVDMVTLGVSVTAGSDVCCVHPRPKRGDDHIRPNGEYIQQLLSIWLRLNDAQKRGHRLYVRQYGRSARMRVFRFRVPLLRKYRYYNDPNVNPASGGVYAFIDETCFSA